MAQSGVLPEDLFRVSFKKYKSIKSFKALLSHTSSNNEEDKDTEVVLLDPAEGDLRSSISQRPLNISETYQSSRFGLRPPNTWKVYEFTFPEGLFLIRNPFTKEGQRYWVKRSVVDFPKPPFITNIDNLETKESKSIKSKLSQYEFYQKLRWVTFGYHHNWDTKVYSEDSKSEFPPDLKDLTNFIAAVLGFSDFKAEAAIANYYHLDSTLSGHVDRSEENQSAPLFSLSFGQPAVFLIGGRAKSVKPQAVLLRSGDIAVMSGESRFSYHGVPRILHSSDAPWNYSNPSSPTWADQYDGASKVKKPKLEIICGSSSEEDLKTCQIGLDKCDSSNRLTDTEKNVGEKQNFEISNVEWNDFLKDYVAKSRINLNIRQVLFPGQTQLS